MHQSADVNTIERGMLFVVIAVVPIISTTSLSPLNSPRPESSTRLLISMDVTPRRPIHPDCTSTSVDPKLFLHLHQSRAPYSSFGRSVLEILFHLVSLSLSLSFSPDVQNTISVISIYMRRAPRVTILFYRAAHRSTSLHSSISRAAHPINFRV